VILDDLKELRTLKMLQKHFPSYHRTKQYMNNLVRREIIIPPKRIMWNDDGRPVNLYCIRDIPYRLLKHEITAGLFGDKFREAGIDVKVGKLPTSCDRYMEIDGIPFYIEIDMATENEGQLSQVLSKYRGERGYVLFATVNREQMLLAQGLAEQVQEQAFFAFIPDVLADPFGRVWQDAKGQLAAVPKPSTKSL
jgi:hypothetical protein